MQRLTISAAWLSLMCSVLAVLCFVAGYRSSLALPDIPRPNTGPGFSESATAAFGGALLGWWFAAVGAALGVFAQVVGPRRLLKMALAIPAAAFVSLPFFIVK